MIDSEAYLLTCMRYIELNPAWAGMVVDPADYLWSSHLVNDLGQASHLIEPHQEYGDWGRQPKPSKPLIVACLSTA